MTATPSTVTVPAATPTAPELTVETEAEPLVVEVFSDLICPWCYIGSARLRVALAQLNAAGGLPGARRIQVLWQPFELNPNMPVAGLDRKQYRSAKFGSWAHSQQLDAQVAAAGAPDGLTFRHDRISRTPNTLAGHRLVWFAQEHGLGQQMVERLFSAYFTEGIDIGDPAVLTTLAVEIGLDSARATDTVAGTGDAGILAAAAVTTARQRAAALGISGVPFYVLANTYGLSGAQPAETLVAMLRRVTAELHPAVLALPDTATDVAAAPGTIDGVCGIDGSCT
jgi:predicted DsbA family dithiol-disulfide isomerase